MKAPGAGAAGAVAIVAKPSRVTGKEEKQLESNAEVSAADSRHLAWSDSKLFKVFDFR